MATLHDWSLALGPPSGMSLFLLSSCYPFLVFFTLRFPNTRESTEAVYIGLGEAGDTTIAVSRVCLVHICRAVRGYSLIKYCPVLVMLKYTVVGI